MGNDLLPVYAIERGLWLHRNGLVVRVIAGRERANSA